MAERIYPTAKPNPHPPQTKPPNTAPAFPATKSQMYGNTRPAYRPQPQKRRSRRSRCTFCCCTCWILLFIIAAVLIAAIAGGIFYVLYSPHRPTFTVSSMKLSQLNITRGNFLISKLDVAVTARNPNKKIEFMYDTVTISVTSNGVDIGDGAFPGFVHGKKNTTVLQTTVKSDKLSIDGPTASMLRKMSRLPVEIELETRAGVKVGGLKTKKIGITVNCQGFDIAVPKKKSGSAATPDVSCKVKLRIKIWKWTL